MNCIMEGCINSAETLEDYCASCKKGIISRILKLDHERTRRRQGIKHNSVKQEQRRHDENFQKPAHRFYPPWERRA